jgi:ATP-dependent DNA helicase RecQ
MDSSDTSLDQTRQPLQAVLKKTWGYDGFRPLQWEAMRSVMAGRDSLVVMPTGGGKSLCYQAPALAMEGTAIVISPLLSLMKDQVDALHECGVPAAFLNSSQTPVERRDVRSEFEAGKLKLLYMAPERIRSDDLKCLLANGPVSFFAIDEAHCVSLWGHDFRPEYRELRTLREVCPKAAVHAYTATATGAVRKDIATQLQLEKPEVLVGDFDRPNLSYAVERRAKNRGFDQIVEVMRRFPHESGIVYCLSRKDVERLSHDLNEEGFRTLPYHAGLEDRVRRKNQDSFINDVVTTMVATVAFGMGIDKSNVRYVIHAGLPASLESYQQESGRAGRDGLPSECRLLFSSGDVLTWQRRIDEQPDSLRPHSLKRLSRMVDYCQAPRCRHRDLVQYFGQDLAADCRTGCDVCAGEMELVADSLIVAQKILSSIHRQGQRFGATYTAQVLMGSKDSRIEQNGHQSLSTYGLLKGHREDEIVGWIGQLAAQGFLEREGEYQTLQITPDGRRMLKGEAPVRLLAVSKATGGKTARRRSTDAVELPELFEELRNLRLEIAREKGAPPYTVCSDATLKDMVRLRPSSVDDLINVSGIGRHKQSLYGQRFVDCLVAWCSREGVPMDVVLEAG